MCKAAQPTDFVICWINNKGAKMLGKIESSESLDPRVKRTRRWIMEAFMALLQKKTINAISVQDIAAEAGINRATFYAHFDDKFDLFDYLVRETFLQMVYSHIDENAVYCVDNLKELIITTCEYLQKFGGKCHPGDKQNESSIELQVQSQIYDIVLNWLGGDSANRAKAQVISWAIFGVGLDWRKHSAGQSTVTAAEELISLLKHGVLVDDND
jgi:AcrR family transcriptional regulator